MWTSFFRKMKSVCQKNETFCSEKREHDCTSQFWKNCTSQKLSRNEISIRRAGLRMASFRNDQVHCFLFWWIFLALRRLVTFATKRLRDPWRISKIFDDPQQFVGVPKSRYELLGLYCSIIIFFPVFQM